MKDAKSAYQNGLIDATSGAESAAALLANAGERELFSAYMDGWIAGSNLERDRVPGLIVEETEG